MPTSSSTDRIECRVGSWFVRRVWILGLMFSVVALYFLYDGCVGYPKKNFDAALFAAFEAGKSGAVNLPKAGDFWRDEFSEKQLAELQTAHDAGKSDGTWSKFAATRHLAASEPKKHSRNEMNVQKGYAAVLALGGIGVLLFFLTQRGKMLACDQSGIEFSNGKRIEFQSVASLDLTKWDRGIALLKTDSGKSAKIDDYKFEGAGKIVTRLREKRPDLEIISAS